MAPLSEIKVSSLVFHTRGQIKLLLYHMVHFLDIKMLENDGSIPFADSWFSPDEVFKELMDIMLYQAEQKEIQLSYECTRF